jgi:glycosyltransferase involved in cell wall biosynthesis
MFCDDDEGYPGRSRRAPRFKPGWSPDLYATLNFPRQTVLVSRAALDRLGAMPLHAADPLHEITRSGGRSKFCVRHIPLVLHHRSGDASTRIDTENLIARYDRSIPLNPNLAHTRNGIAIVPRRIVRGTVPPFRAMMFTPNLNREGAPYSQFELTRALRDRGVIAPEVISFHDGPLHELYRSAGIPVDIQAPILTEIPTLRRYQRAIARVARIIRHRRPGVVYANTLLNFPAIEAASREGVASIWNPRESEPWQSAFGYLSESVAQRALACFPLPYRVVFVAHATENAWARFNVACNAAVIHNGLDLRRFAPSRTPAARTHARQSLVVNDDELMVLLLGTVCERKGQRDLAAAIARLAQKLVARAWFFIVGDEPGPYSDDLKRDIAKLPAEAANRVRVIPTASDVGLYYRAADIFVLTSRFESFPRVILEAMAHALPIVTTPCFGVTEQVVEGRNALLYVAGDANRLAAALSEVMTDDILRAAMSAASTTRLGALTTFDEMVGKYAEVFREAYLSR